ncbi:hypothetical protein BT93_F0522 [Corymbia citriodora subsp. variegata]|nr:hypothetical protein BT93_F0522 [Corymbia citriodora subsp. variegata]
MDTLGASSADEEWDYLSLFPSTEELIDFSPYVPGQHPFSHERDTKFNFPNPPFPINPELNTDFAGMSGNSRYPLVLNPDLQTVSQESSYFTGKSNCFVVSSSGPENGINSNNHMQLANEISPYFDAFYKDGNNSNSFVSELSGTLMEEGACLKEMHSEKRGCLGNNQPEDVSMPLMRLQLERRSSRLDNVGAVAGHSTSIDVSQNTKKRPCTSRDMIFMNERGAILFKIIPHEQSYYVQLRKKNNSPRNAKKLLSDNDDGDESNVRPNRSRGCNGENSNSGKLNGELTPSFKTSTALTDNGNIGKIIATKGSAMDSQSLYARRRRARINERLRILQSLVPNGTKVDISTMLEEAVHYVKFLQLQIKLLSSDELWMYAPLAYNGMEVNLSHTIFPQL